MKVFELMKILEETPPDLKVVTSPTYNSSTGKEEWKSNLECYTLSMNKNKYNGTFSFSEEEGELVLVLE